MHRDGMPRLEILISKLAQSPLLTLYPVQPLSIAYELRVCAPGTGVLSVPSETEVVIISQDVMLIQATG